MSKIKRIHVYVTGRVQGVYYRLSTQKEAVKLGLTGWVKNLPDGRVEFIAQGLEDHVNSLITWAKNGPQYAKVDNLELSEEKVVEEFNDFTIHY